MTVPFKAVYRVEFRDTDAAGIMHFSTFITYMEEAEHALLRSLDLSVMNCEVEGVRISWPRVSVSCDYRRPLHFEDEFEVLVSVGNLGNTSITYDFSFTSEGQTRAKGKITAVCCQIGEAGMESIPIPGSLRESLKPFLVE